MPSHGRVFHGFSLCQAVVGQPQGQQQKTPIMDRKACFRLRPWSLKKKPYRKVVPTYTHMCIFVCTMCNYMCVMICSYIWMIIQDYVVDKIFWHSKGSYVTACHSVSQRFTTTTYSGVRESEAHYNMCLIIWEMVQYEHIMWIWYILWVSHSFRKIWCIYLDFWSFFLVFRRP